MISPALIILFFLNIIFLIAAFTFDSKEPIQYALIAMLALLLWAMFWRFLSVKWGFQRIMLSRPAIAVIFLTAFSATVSFLFSTHLLVYTSVFIFTSALTIFIWSLLASAGLTVRRDHLRIALTGQPLEVKITLINKSRWPRFTVIGFDYFPAVSSEAGYQEMCFVSIRGHSEVTLTYEAVPTLRGDWRVGPFYFWGGDPFGFFKHERLVETLTELIVVPVPFKVKMQSLDSVSMRHKDEAATIEKAGESIEFLGVREYREGDSIRKIHWISSARTGELITKQFELNVASTISFLLLNSAEMGRGKNPEKTPLEDSLRIIISLAQAAINSAYQVSFMEIGGADERAARTGGGRKFLSDLSVQLAKIGEGGDVNIRSELKWIAELIPVGSNLFVFTDRYKKGDDDVFNQLHGRFRNLTVVHFDVESYEAGRRTISTIRTAGSGRFLTYRLENGDDLKIVTERILRLANREAAHHV